MISMNLSKTRKRFEKKHQLKDNRIYEFFTMFVTFFIVCIGLVLFRAESIGQAWEYFIGMVQFGTLRSSYRFFIQPNMWPTNLFIVIMLVVEWLQRGKEHGLSGFDRLTLLKNEYVRVAMYSMLLIFIILFGVKHTTFIYFQF